MGKTAIFTGFISFALLLFSSAVSAAETVPLDGTTDEKDLSPYIEILPDEDGEWTIDDVSSAGFHDEFELNSGGAPSFGYTETVYWVRVRLENRSDYSNWRIELDNPPMDRADFYSPTLDEAAWNVERTGDLRPFHERPFINRQFIFPVEIPEGEERIFYLRLESEGAMQIPLTLYNQQRFIQHTQVDYLIFGLFIGLAVVMALYNLFIYFSLRERSYLYYVLFIVANIFTLLAFSGLAYQYLWPEAVWWNNRSIIFFMATANIFAVFFARNFLEAEGVVPWEKKGFIGAVVANAAILAVLAFSYPLALDLIVLASLMTVGIIITLAYKMLRSGFRPARFFFAAWIVFIIGVFVSVFTDLGVLPFSFITKYAWQLTTAVELVLLSFALADKINTIKQEKKEAQAEVYRHQQRMNDFLRKQNERLEEKVNERTEKLSKSNQILNKRNTELQKAEQFRVELLTNISHELGTPMTYLQSYVQTAREGIIDANDEKFLMTVESKVKLLDRLIHDLFELVKLESGKISMMLETVDVSDWIDDIHCHFRQDVEKAGIRFPEPVIDGLIPSDKNVLATVDRTRLLQVFTNLLYNATKHTPKGGSISIVLKVEQGHTDPDFDGKAVIEIRDTGEGIDPDFLPHIFERFFHKVDRNAVSSGTGLGLAITKEIISYHRGEIWAESVQGSGTSVYFTLPVIFE
ncbi:sensor histidine kinase [Salisediminibacterium halotolerans]|uniref:sensor histidine kinase n=1 Tax=Salisediminibacterium halotolerans TaxID=517425 RepID=UPI000EB3796B|nr:sensor histidine kinase [Salisediminibacterium halotolerans]RLJ71723.1 phospho-acceptor domain-containing protein [Actinophytocola xinjiangensis]RPE86873.1 phospho-acceptor domain-containing protein [Salisediminibacterium halotolerans]TWG32936.1 phospho-acceptor domain-containing protein [Salisediminibacterium halotolerans]GEL08202.1 hybrid sensor histidine kinase/response regulator [Salisediminibacterium halotolerans]